MLILELEFTSSDPDIPRGGCADSYPNLSNPDVARLSSIPPCPSSPAGFARSAVTTCHISKFRFNAFNRSSLKIMKPSFLDSQQTCRSVRRVSPRSVCANDAQRCISHLGHFLSGLHMSVYGIRGGCHPRGTTRRSGRQGWSLDLFCVWHGGHSSLSGRLIIDLKGSCLHEG